MKRICSFRLGKETERQINELALLLQQADTTGSYTDRTTGLPNKTAAIEYAIRALLDQRKAAHPPIKGRRRKKPAAST